ncbi:MAG: DUF3822 family protein [Prolixibacteraceae bacterium]|jgi:hypothetical protein|nr:DUF3822 family protein [Prolixibacteraceae bacterium]
MHDICFIDKSFDPEQTNLYHLSIQISLDGFSYAILDIPRGKYTVLKSANLFLKRPRLLFMKVRELMNEDEHLNLKYKSIEIVYSSENFTLVPHAFYQQGSADKFFGFNHSAERGFVVDKTLLTKAEAWCIFNIPENLKEFLALKYPKATIRHNLYPLVERALKENKNFPERKQVHINFFRSCFELIVLSGTKLQLCNQFNYSGENDISYFVLYVFDQLKLPPDTTELVIHGLMQQTDPIYQTLRKYIRKTSFARPTSLFNYSYTFNQLPDHYFTSLLDLYKCE